ncbi:MAG: hypothetical protein QOJ29_3498 [Thermoleophilaceae bacterium]|jgi:hypothetical protein|nr:hypothetical protein [Thermoleophilaceae bacterium]
MWQSEERLGAAGSHGHREAVGVARGELAVPDTAEFRKIKRAQEPARRSSSAVTLCPAALRPRVHRGGHGFGLSAVGDPPVAYDVEVQALVACDGAVSRERYANSIVRVSRLLGRIRVRLAPARDFRLVFTRRRLPSRPMW